ncbi:MAG TPA: hypothetical protein VIH34_02670 [Candidatus Bathyarchaeia archaeon]
MQKRLLILPITWLSFGLVEVVALRYLFGPIADIAPATPNDKPIGGSVLPVLFFNVAILSIVIAASLYSLGAWRVDLSSRKTRMNLLALSVLFLSGFLLWYSPIALFSGLASLVYFLSVNVE